VSETSEWGRQVNAILADLEKRVTAAEGRLDAGAAVHGALVARVADAGLRAAEAGESADAGPRLARATRVLLDELARCGSVCVGWGGRLLTLEEAQATPLLLHPRCSQARTPVMLTEEA
jgi:hypothetical protein